MRRAQFLMLTITLEQPYLRLYLHLLLQVVKVGCISVVVLRVKPLLQPPLLFQALVLLLSLGVNFDVINILTLHLTIDVSV